MRFAPVLRTLVRSRRIPTLDYPPVDHKIAALLGAAALALIVAGCAPQYAKSEYVSASDAVPSGARGKPASRAHISLPHIPLPSPELLRPEAEPTCDSTAAGLGNADRPASASAQLAGLGAEQWPEGQVVSDAAPPAVAVSAKPGVVLAQAAGDDNLVLLTKLALEAVCYRQAELAVRKRLHELQASVAETIRAVKAQANGSSEPSHAEERR